jgi:exodeoxyribonuclease VII large subunit
VAVQGPGAAEQIAQAVRELNDDADVQVIIVARGGGTPEDLWAFNEEIVARAIFASRLPVVSGVGHEIDVTIADLVADLRAPTPSAAGEMVVPDGQEVMALLQAIHGRMNRALMAWVRERGQRIAALAASHGMRRCASRVEQGADRLRAIEGRLSRGWSHLLAGWRGRVQARIEQLTAFNPRQVLARGYSICRRLADLMIVSDAGVLHPGDAIEVTMARGRAEGSVSRVFSQHVSEREEQAQNGREDEF